MPGGKSITLTIQSYRAAGPGPPSPASHQGLLSSPNLSCLFCSEPWSLLTPLPGRRPPCIFVRLVVKVAAQPSDLWEAFLDYIVSVTGLCHQS